MLSQIEEGDYQVFTKTVCQELRIIRDGKGMLKMQRGGKEEEEVKKKKRKPYQKPELTVEELFEATVLGCTKATGKACGAHFNKQS